MTTNFLGIPVTGDITKGPRQVEQRPDHEFEFIVSRLLSEPSIVEFGWTQYTPYFNDGEPCVFGGNGVWVRTTSDLPDSERENEEGVAEYLSVDYGHPTLGGLDYAGDYKKPPTYKGEHESLFFMCRELSQAVQGGQFDHLLLKLFGDHAEVTVSREKITIDSYSHD